MNMFTLQTLAAKAEQSGEDLGGFMSPERLEIAGQVVLIGMGMVGLGGLLMYGLLRWQPEGAFGFLLMLTGGYCCWCWGRACGC